jgi:D-alanyl-D-alanine carboxypeptidase
LNAQKVLSQIERYTEIIAGETNIPGLSVAVTDRKETIGIYTYGFSDISARSPVTSNTLFEIASVGKPFTAIVLLQLYEEGKLDLNASVDKYLPWFKVQSGYQPVTLHHLLGHTAGIIRGTEQAPYGLYDVWALRETETGFPPGTHWHYSSVGYKTLGFLMEELTGQSLKQLVQSRILSPLGMMNTHASVTFETRKRAATGYCSLYDDRPEDSGHMLVPAIWSECSTGDGCLASTSEDMAIFLRMLLNRGEGTNGRLITEESYYRMAPLGKRSDSEQYGYALVAYPVDGHVFLGHGGGNAGFTSHVLADVDEGLGVAVLTNRRTESESVYRLAEYILKVLHAESTGSQYPPLPHSSLDYSVHNAEDYAGAYKSGESIFEMTAENGNLMLHLGGKTAPMEPRGKDRFYVRHPDMDIFLFEFNRDGENVVEAFHGPNWFINDRYIGQTNFNYPAEWNTYTGHYRTRNPELSNFRVLLRKGTLVFIYPSGDVEPLRPAGTGLFYVGDDLSPETLKFDAICEGKALKAVYSGCPYFRTFST